MHFAHHTHTQDWEKDGELVRAPYTLTTYLLWLSGVTYWRNRIFGVIRRARGVIIEPFIRTEEEAKIIFESRVHLALYAAIFLVSIAMNSWAALSFWLLPMLLTKPVHQLQNTIEHLGLSHENDILKNTRSNADQCADALAVLADALSYGASCVSLSAVLEVAAAECED